MFVAFCCGIPQARSQAAAGTPVSQRLTGRVSDARGKAIAGVSIQLSGKGKNLSAQTDSDGKYFLLLAPGTYTGRAESRKYETATFGPFTLGKNETKALNLTLREQTSEKGSALGSPEFFDQPQFTIAGVTDTTNLGGHASGMTGPSESLAKDVIGLAPTTSPAATNSAAEHAARERADKNTSDFEANHSAGKLLLDDGKPHEALMYLTRASKLNPNNYANSYDLAQGYAGAGDYTEARALIRMLLEQKQSADLHHLLATVEEKSGNPLEAEREFQQGAKLDPNEINLFDWGMELLTHHALEPAIEVFRSANRRFPQSTRLLSGLAVASYERGLYEEALQYACAATELDSHDASPYLLLGKMESADHGQSDAPLLKLQHFADMQPENAWANYYYALALWKRRKGPEDVSTAMQVESLLQKAARLDPKLAKAYFQLGVLYSEKNNLPQAMSAYESAVRIDPQLAEAHYRLAQAYVASGQKEKGEQEIALYKQNSKAKADAMDQERREVQQFVYTMQDRLGVPTSQ
jgi:tetratricopeptide (TPR) repeat protein